jgi:hypothetical protein
MMLRNLPLVVFALGLSASAFGQAAAESALTTAGAGSSTAAIASKLGRALDGNTQQLGDRIQKSAAPAPAVQPPATTPSSPATASSAPAAVPPGNAAAISIQGATCKGGLANPAGQNKPDQGSTSAGCRDATTALRRDQKNYQSVINF